MATPDGNNRKKKIQFPRLSRQREQCQIADDSSPSTVCGWIGSIHHRGYYEGWNRMTVATIAPRLTGHKSSSEHAHCASA